MHRESNWSYAIGAALLGAALLAAPPAASAQNGSGEVRRPIPAPVTAPSFYERAIERGWRSRDGSPGPNYWQQWTTYDLKAKLDPETGRVEGTAHILYASNAPATYTTVWLNLHQNLHKAGSPRNTAEEITGGVTLTEVLVDGEPVESRANVADGPGYQVNGTLMQVRPELQIEQGDTLELQIGFEFTMPQNGSGRMGHSDREMYFVAYWFPKIAVLDDLRLWDAEPYLGSAEFYDGFGDYTAELTVPTGWSVMATGDLLNPEEVFSALTLERLREAATADEAVLIAGQGERDAGTVTAAGTDGWITYRFAADSVRDFTWTTSNVQHWKATSAVVPDNDGDGTSDRVMIHSFYRPDRAPLWEEQWKYAKQSVEYHSTYTGLTYPWPHMTSVEGDKIIGGGMEFPMLTIMGPYRGSDAQALFNVTSHEIAHMWVPMIVGTNEKRHAWMDEGATTFLEDQSRMEYWPGVDHHRIEAASYLRVAAAGLEQSLMRHADWYEPGPGGGIASYAKPATLMVALRGVMGQERWERAYRTFLSEWAYKHPTPWDFFATFERFAERDLDWFWTPFYYESWTLDHAVDEVVRHAGGGATVRIRDRGFAPFPATVRIRTSGGETLVHEVPVEHWLDGHWVYEIDVPASAGTVTRVELDPSGYVPDVDRSNNIWPRG